MRSPRPQYLSADHVLEEMVRFGTRRLRHSSLAQLMVLALMAGVFIGAGALFSVLLTVGADPGGAHDLLAGLGFSAGFFFVILFMAVTLFVTANFQHPPADMLGGAVLVALPFWYALRPEARRVVRDRVEVTGRG